MIRYPAVSVTIHEAIPVEDDLSLSRCEHRQLRDCVSKLSNAPDDYGALTVFVGGGRPIMCCECARFVRVAVTDTDLIVCDHPWDERLSRAIPLPQSA
jgi:hypothetical protein